MNQTTKMKVTLLSFGFKHGTPENLNYLWDVRCLPNPYWVEELRPRTGLDHEVSEYILGSAPGREFIKLLKPFIFFLVQQHVSMDKKELVMAVGCTGGRHRSVAVVEVLCDILKMLPLEMHCVHRDVEREA